MTITKNLTHTLFITALIMLTITSSHLLHTMEPATVNTTDEIAMEADFQTYLLLSSIDNNQYYLLPELIGIIAINVSKLIDEYAYNKYDGEKYLNDPISLLKFIKNRCKQSMSHVSTAAIIKRCLRHSDKALSEIKGDMDKIVFHETSWQEHAYTDYTMAHNEALARVEWIKILCLVAEKEAWNMICMQTFSNATSLMLNHAYPHNITALLSVAPNSQSAWELIIAPKDPEYNALTFAQVFQSTDTLKLLESYRPKEQQFEK